VIAEFALIIVAGQVVFRSGIGTLKGGRIVDGHGLQHGVGLPLGHRAIPVCAINHPPIGLDKAIPVGLPAFS
jgi:hypothetical protein